MTTLTSALPLDASGLPASLAAAFRSLSALLPDLALKGAVLLLLALLVDAVLRRASAATRHAHWQLALGGTLALALLAPLLPRIPVALPLPLLLFAHECEAATAAAAPAVPQLSEPPLVRGEMSCDMRPDASADAKDAVCSAPAVSEMRADEAVSSASGAAVMAAVDMASRHEARVAPRTACAPVRAPVCAPAGTQRGILATGGEERDTSDTRPARSLPARVRDSLASLGLGAWLTLAWAAGAAVVLAVLACSVLRARSIGASARPLVDSDWLALLDRTAGELSLRRRVRLLIADGPVVPMTWGWSHPVVLLPADARDWSPPRRRQVLLHELAHIQRGDWLTQLLAQVACALYWYQPLAWLAARRLRQQREHACDDRVLAAGNRASDYAGHLLDIARTRRTSHTAGFATLAMARPSQLEGRLLAVLDERRDRRALPGRRTLIAGGVASALVLALACVQPRAADATPTAARAAMGDAGSVGAQDAAAQAAQADAALSQADAALSQVAAARAEHDASVASSAHMSQEAVRVAQLHAAEVARSISRRDGTARTPMPARFELTTMNGRPALAPVALMPFGSLSGQIAPAPPAQGGPGGTPAPPALPGTPAATSPGLPRLPRMPGMPASPDPFTAWTEESFAGMDGDWDNESSWNCDEKQEWSWAEGGEAWHVAVRDCVEADETGGKLGRVGDGGLAVPVLVLDGTTDRIEATGGGEDENGNAVTTVSGSLAGSVAEPAALRTELDRLLPVVLGRTGLFASQRVDWLLAHGGVSAVIAEIAALPGEAARAAWYRTLLAEHELGSADTAVVLAHAGQDLPTDAFLAPLLGDVGPDLLADPDLAVPLFAALDGVESDAYQAEVLGQWMDADDIDGPLLASALQCATAGLESDAYMAQVLGEVPGGRLRDPAVRQAFLAALNTLGSDAYEAQVLEPLMDQRGVKGETLAALLAEAATSIDSDAYLAEVLGQLPARALADERVRAAALAALGTIESDACLAEVLGAFIDESDTPAPALGELLDAAAGGLDSDAYMAEVLARLPHEAVADAALRPRLDAALATIESPSYRAEVEEALGLEKEGA